MQSQGRGPGAFSDTYPPEQRCLPLRCWPEQDRRAFEIARRPADVFELSGPASHWADETCRVRIQAYGRYLNFLQRNGWLLPTDGVEDRAVPDRIAAYIAEARQFLAPISLNQSLRELSLILGAMVPDRDWSWIARHPARASASQVRASRKPKRVFDPKALCFEALELMDHISAGPITYEMHILYRSLLMVAMQCVFSLRRRNLIHMRLGRNLVVEEELIRLIYAPEETKTNNPISWLVPDFLKPYLRTYLEQHRPRLLNGRPSHAVWINSRHQALGYGAATTLFSSIGELLLGYPINCHSFRHAVATAIMTKDPRRIKVASGTLTHKQLRVTNQFYDASGDAGSRRVWDKLVRNIVRGGG